MNVEIKNIGIIDNVNIQIGDITVLTGYNDSGKSTISKVLYSLYKGINYSKENLKKDIISFIAIPLQEHEILRFFSGSSFERKLSLLSIDELIHDKAKVKEIIFNSMGKSVTEDVLIELDDILDNISQKGFLDTIHSVIISRIMTSSLGGQLLNVYSNQLQGEININNEDSVFNCKFVRDEERYEYVGELTIPSGINFSDAIYIESPLMLTLANIPFNDHMVMSPMKDLIKKLRHQWSGMNNSILDAGIVIQNAELVSRINTILNGNVRLSNSNLSYHKNDGKIFDIGNIANGLKTYGIIKRLLDNGWLSRKTLLIIDEPEVHLHPEWQLKLAEILVLISKSLPVKLLLTTHSPYFLQAIDAYSKKYKVNERNNYYWVNKQDKGSVVECINGHLDVAYNTLVKPMDELIMLFEEVENDD